MGGICVWWEGFVSGWEGSVAGWEDLCPVGRGLCLVGVVCICWEGSVYGWEGSVATFLALLQSWRTSRSGEASSHAPFLGVRLSPNRSTAASGRTFTFSSTFFMKELVCKSRWSSCVMLVQRNQLDSTESIEPSHRMVGADGVVLILHSATISTVMAPHAVSCQRASV